MRLFEKDTKAAIFVSGNDKGILRVASYLAQDIRDVTGCHVKASRVVRSLDLDNGTAEGCRLVIAAGMNLDLNLCVLLKVSAFLMR